MSACTTSSAELRSSGRWFAPSGGWATLWQIARRYPRQLAFTYALFAAENAIALALPWALGYAVDALARDRYHGLVGLAAAYLAHIVIGVSRRVTDSRVFLAIYGDLCQELVAEQRQHGVEVSQVAARSSLMRLLVDFFEADLLFMIQSASFLIGALLLLCSYDVVLGALSSLLLVPFGIANAAYSNRLRHLNRGLHDRLECEVDVIARNSTAEVAAHYRDLAFWRIRISDWEAANTGFVQLLLTVLILASIYRLCVVRQAAAGETLAAVRYVLMLISAAGAFPMIMQQFTRVRDVLQRVCVPAQGRTVASGCAPTADGHGAWPQSGS